MEIIKKEIYVCGICRKSHDNRADALSCEKQDRLRNERDNLVVFRITDEHLKLLKEMNVGWNDCEFGAPQIDPKRPYGNSDGVDDVARVIGYKKTKERVEFDKEDAKEYDDIKEYLENCDWDQESYDYLRNLHKDMEIVLQIVLSTLSFKKGVYQRDETYSSDWRFKND